MSEKDVHVTINEEINRVSVAGQDSSPAAWLVIAWRFLPTPRIPHKRARMYSVQGTNCYIDRAANQSAQTPSWRTSWNRTQEVNRLQLCVLAVHGSRHWRNGSSVRVLRSSNKAVFQGNTALVVSRRNN
jgi:hypothetical protein